jgi:hypothetical protein
VRLRRAWLSRACSCAPFRAHVCPHACVGVIIWAPCCVCAARGAWRHLARAATAGVWCAGCDPWQAACCVVCAARVTAGLRARARVSWLVACVRAEPSRRAHSRAWWRSADPPAAHTTTDPHIPRVLALFPLRASVARPPGDALSLGRGNGTLHAAAGCACAARFRMQCFSLCAFSSWCGIGCWVWHRPAGSCSRSRICVC